MKIMGFRQQIETEVRPHTWTQQDIPHIVQECPVLAAVPILNRHVSRGPSIAHTV